MFLSLLPIGEHPLPDTVASTPVKTVVGDEDSEEED